MSGLPQPTKTRIRSLILNGVDLTEFVNRLSVYETIKKPYHTAKLTIIDNNNLLENMGLVGEETCSFAFDGGEIGNPRLDPITGEETSTFGLYENTLKVLSVHGNKSKQGLRSMQYDIHLIGQEFFSDKENLVQREFKGIPGTAAISQIHSEYIGGGLNIHGSSTTIGKESYRVQSKHPFTGINEIRQRLVPEGNWVYFKNRDGHHLAPLSALYAEAGNDETFIQKATWGANWFDVVEAQRAIIVAVADVDDQKPGSAASGARASTKGQKQSIFDLATKKMVKDGMKGGKLGGMPNMHMIDSKNNDEASDPSAKTIGENLFRSQVQDTASMSVKVPIQSGINVTVGRGCYLSLMAPIGDLTSPPDGGGESRLAGTYMIADLCHELFLDDRQQNGTTTFQAYRVS